MTARPSYALFSELRSPLALPPTLVGESETMREVARVVVALAEDARVPVLLAGETGTGKGNVAAFMHARGPRNHRPFGKLHLDANRDTVRTLMGAAAGGSIYVEQLGALALDAQDILLDELDTAHFGVRISASSADDLVTAVTEGRMNETLYYRFGAAVHIPPLRARAHEDIVAVTTRILDDLRAEISGVPPAVADDALAAIVSHAWPGNLRELRNVLERAVITVLGEPVLRRVHLPQDLHDDSGTVAPRTLVEVERAHIHRTLRAHKHNRTHAAKELGISRATLIKKIKEYGLAFGGASFPGGRS